MSNQHKNTTTEDHRLRKWFDLKKPAEQDQQKSYQRPENLPIPLSFGQLRLWFLQQLNPANPFYHYVDSYKITGEIDIDRFLGSFRQLVNRHEILRTTFPARNGSPVQNIHQVLEPEINLYDFRSTDTSASQSEVERISIADASKAFDLEIGPLVRLSLFRLKDQEYFLVLIMHHIITDAWSMDIIREEWACLFRGEKLGSPGEYQYADFAYQQRRRVIDQKDLEYWEHKLSGDLPLLELPNSRKRQGPMTYGGAYYKQAFEPEQLKKLQALCHEHNTTMFVLLLTVFKILLFRYTGVSDLLVATPVTNRDQSKLEKLLGFFNETVVLRDQLRGDMSFLAVLKNVQNTVLEGFAHKNIPFESLVKKLKPERLISTNPLFQVMFLYRKTPETPSLGQGTRWEYQPMDAGVSKFDLTLYLEEEDQQLSAIFEYATDIFDRTAIEMMQGHLHCLVNSVLHQPDSPVASLEILTKSELHQLLSQWSHPVKPFVGPQTMTELIDSSTQKHPDRPALAFRDGSLTYGELNQRVKRLAHKLVSASEGSVGSIGVYAEKGPEMIIGMLAVLKSGGSYVPMDAKYPRSRLEHMIADAKIKLILCQSQLTGCFPDQQVTVVSLDDSQETSSAHRLPLVEAASNAYIIYTSGSTGTPKGVPVTHRNLVSSTLARISYYQDQPEAFLLMSPFSFDSSVAGIFWTLCSGGTLVLPEERLEQDIDALSSLIDKHKITHTLLIPSLFDLLLKHGDQRKLTSLNSVILAGESCTSATCALHFDKLPKVKLYNEYGPTEATVWSTVHRITPDDCIGGIPIGRPIENTSIYILDQNMSPVPIGVIGEIYIGGQGVVAGYINQPTLAENPFIENPFTPGPPSLLYRTGDLGRFRTDGVIEFLGRADQQLKIRGFRVEPEEIQSVINRFPGIEDSALVLRPKENSSALGQDIENDTDSIVAMLEDMDPRQAENLLRSVESIEHFNFSDTDDQEN